MSEFRHVTEWIDDTKEDFLKLVESMVEKAKLYKEFVNNFYKVDGVHVELYLLDEDFVFVEAEYPPVRSEMKDVAKWAITFTPNHVDKDTFSVKGADSITYYTLINTTTNQEVFAGRYTEVVNHIEENYSTMSEEEFDKTYTWNNREVYIYQEWLEEIGTKLDIKVCEHKLVKGG